MSTDPEDREDPGFEEQEASEFLPDTLSSPAGQVYFGGDADKFLTKWLGRLGLGLDGGAIVFDESGGVRIIHPETGDLLTPKDIAKMASAQNLRRVQ